MKKNELHDKIYKEFGNWVVIISSDYFELEKMVNDETLYHFYKDVRADFNKAFEKFLYGDEMQAIIPDIESADVKKRGTEFKKMMEAFDYSWAKLYDRLDTEIDYNIISDDLMHDLEKKIEDFEYHHKIMMLNLS